MNEWEKHCIKWHGHTLTGKKAHYCEDWDGLPIDETCKEFECCTCSVIDGFQMKFNAM